LTSVSAQDSLNRLRAFVSSCETSTLTHDAVGNLRSASNAVSGTNAVFSASSLQREGD
jgi:hypothetical protein